MHIDVDLSGFHGRNNSRRRCYLTLNDIAINIRHQIQYYRASYPHCSLVKVRHYDRTAQASYYYPKLEFVLRLRQVERT